MANRYAHIFLPVVNAWRMRSILRQTSANLSGPVRFRAPLSSVPLKIGLTTKWTQFQYYDELTATPEGGGNPEKGLGLRDAISTY